MIVKTSSVDSLPISSSTICEQKFVQHGPITIAIYCSGLSFLIFEEKWPNYASGPKFSPNSESFSVRRLFNVCLHTRQGQNELHLKRSFFLPKKSIAGSLPSVIQAYTQPYSFGGSTKLILCQIRYELGVTIHEISTS